MDSLFWVKLCHLSYLNIPKERQRLREAVSIDLDRDAGVDMHDQVDHFAQVGLQLLPTGLNELLVLEGK